MLSNISNILFDLDGTLTDPREGITRCIQYALGRFNKSIPPWEQLTWCIGPPLKASFAQLLNTRTKQFSTGPWSIIENDSLKKACSKIRFTPELFQP